MLFIFMIINATIYGLASYYLGASVVIPLLLVHASGFMQATF